MFYTVAHLRELEKAALAQHLPLMERAGRAAAEWAATHNAGPVLILVGPGNNGGDALVAARHLQARGTAVHLVMPAGPDRFPPDASQAWRHWQAAGGTALSTIPSTALSFLIDGLFGIGLNRALDNSWQDLIDQANSLALPTLSLDVPSGVQADTGALLGRPICADWTLSFIGPARGLATGAALDHVGSLLCDSLGLPLDRLAHADVSLTAAVADSIRLLRPRDSHKGRFGSLTIAGGSAGMAGAVLLCGRAALHAGAGKVFGLLLDPAAPTVDPTLPELMLRHDDGRLIETADTLVIGPGLGRSADALALLTRALACNRPLLLDADALNLLAENAPLVDKLTQRHATTVLTPHPSEAARLLGSDTKSIQDNRYAAAESLASRYRATVVLKGAGSLICDGTRTAVCQAGSPALANAGQGDVLSGIVGALLAQGLGGWDAACLGVQVHAAASDHLVSLDGRLVTLASDVAVQAGRALRRYSLSS
jgi:hydroxyethylthiazole kinase-like uncharacterized protein yjeF